MGAASQHGRGGCQAGLAPHRSSVTCAKPEGLEECQCLVSRSTTDVKFICPLTSLSPLTLSLPHSLNTNTTDTPASYRVRQHAHTHTQLPAPFTRYQRGRGGRQAWCGGSKGVSGASTQTCLRYRSCDYTAPLSHHAHTHTHTHTHAHTYIHTYIHTHAHTHAHTLVHAHTTPFTHARTHVPSPQRTYIPTKY